MASRAFAAAKPGTPALDELTLRRAQRGDPTAWRQLVGHYQRPIHAAIWRLLAGRAAHRAEDLTQETFVRVLRALPKFDPHGPASLLTWMLTIATRLALNELRRAVHSELGPSNEPPARDRTDHAAERRRTGSAILAGLAELSADHRAVLVLREFHDLDYQAIASALEIDLGTVKSRLGRARLALRDYLVASGVTPSGAADE